MRHSPGSSPSGRQSRRWAPCGLDGTTAALATLSLAFSHWADPDPGAGVEQSSDDAEGRGAAALAEYFVGDLTMGEALAKMCQAALDAVPQARLAGLSMTVDARVGTYVFTHPEVAQVDQAQYDTGDGPCVDAFRTGQPVLVRSTGEPGPYPDFRAVAARHGLHSTVSLPMNAGGHTVGALNLYADGADAFYQVAIDTATHFATQAAYLLLNHQAGWDAHSLSENLAAAMASRAEIEQAKGIIMAATGCTPDEAFDRLRQQSQHENVKLRDLARELVARQRHVRRPGGPAAS